MGRRPIAMVAAVAMALAVGTAQGQELPTVAVFNFQMKSATPEWVWLEKGLADRLTTDLFQDGNITLVDRDLMEQLAERLHWVPEMLGEPGKLATLRSELRLAYVVSGVYEVRGESLSITAQVVDVNTRREVARRQVEGEAQTVLEMTRRLSAEVLAALTGRKAETVLKALPVWTRSVPAAKALYEGVHLYDQGRYAEAWLAFRRAARHDGGYAEALYWTGKMYYFMDRYEHARSIYEELLYREFRHPRAGDAIVEFLHTYEKLDTPPESLLDMYEALGRRFPEAVVAIEYTRVSAASWLDRKRATLLAYLGRFGEAAAVASIVHKGPLLFIEPREEGQVYSYLVRGHLRQGTLPSLAEIRGFLGLSEQWPLLFTCRPGPNEWVTSPGGSARNRGESHFRGRSLTRILLAPEGHIFQAVTLFPSGGGDGTFAVRVGLERLDDDLLSQTVPLAQAESNGLTIQGLPRSQWLFLANSYRSPQPLGPLRIVAKTEKLTPHGSLDVRCRSTADFRVELDGRAGRIGCGPIGFVPPGRRRVKFLPPPGECLEEFQTAVTVEANRQALVEGRLAWRTGAPLAAWTPPDLVGRQDALPQGYYGEPRGSPPTIQCDDRAIRIVWCSYGDLWWSASTDGEAFSPPRRIELPVSSGWIERDPRCARDESGRLLLAFRGNRGALHNMEPYLCWSRDFLHWSAPALVEPNDGAVGPPRDPAREWVLRGASKPPGLDAPFPPSRGRFAAWKRVKAVTAQEDEYATPPSDGTPADVFRAVFHSLRDRQMQMDFAKVAELLHYQRSAGGEWASPRPMTELLIPEYDRGRHARLLAVQAEGRFVLALAFSTPPGIIFLRQTTDGRWEKSPPVLGVGGSTADLAWHPRWGYVLAWTTDGTADGMPVTGPYVTRGSSLDPLFGWQPGPVTTEWQAGLHLRMARGLEMAGEHDAAEQEYADLIARFAGTEAAGQAKLMLEALRRHRDRLAGSPG